MIKLFGKVKSRITGISISNKDSQLMECICKLCIYITPLIIGLYFTLGRIFLYSGGPIHATDLETPLNPTFYFWNIWYPWHPLALGSRASYTVHDMIYGFISIVSLGNTLVSQILILSLPPIIAYTGTLLLTRRIMGASHIASIHSSFFYAFSPSYLAWFPLPYMLGVAFVPWLFYICLNAVKYVFDQNGSFRTLLLHSLASALVLSLLTGLYFHILPLILMLLVISSIFVMTALPVRVTRNIFRLGVFVCLTGFFYFLLTPRVFDLLSALTGEGSVTLETVTSLNLIKKFYQEATILNILKLAGGTPINERFVLLRGNPSGFFIPILAFSGLLFIKNKDVKHHFQRNSILLYSSFIVNSITLLTIAYIFRELAFSNNLAVTNPYLAGMRRPERILEMLSLFYSLGMAFSISVIELKLHKHSKNLRFLLGLSHRKISLLLLMILILSYVSYSGMYVEPSHPANLELFVPRPMDFKTVEDFYNRNEIQASKYDASYRYLILPLYSPMTAYSRYNYPNIFYAGFFSSKNVSEFIRITNELIAEEDPAAIFPISLASVRYIAILPESFTQNELQAWRLRGETRTSGASLFGDIHEYNTFISGLPYTRLLYENKTAVYVNELAIPRVFVPTMLVHAQGDLEGIFKLLRALNAIIPLSNFALVVNQSGEGNGHSFIVDDFAQASRFEVNISNLTEYKFKYKFKEEATLINERSIIVWSQQKTIHTKNNIITINGTIPPDKQHLSVWIRIPPMKLSLLNIQLLSSNEMLDKISFSILDEEGNTLPAKIEKIISPVIDNKVNLDILVNSMGLRPTWFRVILQGAPNSTVEIALRNEIKFKEIYGLELYLSNTFGAGINQEEGTTFPIVVPNRDNVEVFWPLSIQENTIEYAVTTPIGIDNALLVVISTSKSAGWSKVNEEIKWSSPVDIDIDLDTSLLDEENEILVPLFFGNAYDSSWKLRASTNSGRITEIVHMPGNGYSNIWLVRISGIQNMEGVLHLSFRVQWDNLELYLYRMYTLTGVTLLLTVPFYTLWVKDNKLRTPKDAPAVRARAE